MNTTSTKLVWRCAMAAFSACATLIAGTVSAAGPFAFKDGDRVVLVGATFIERDVRYGCIETLLTMQFRDLNLTFRNLGWSGDEVSGIARASFDPIPVGYDRLVAAIKDAAPTVLLISYGQNESFKGAKGLDDFTARYAKLLDDVAPLNARIVLISPAVQQDMGPLLPNPAEHNKDVRLYVDAVGKLAEQRSLRFIDMTKALTFPTELPMSHWTDNGLHFTEAGYWRAASALIGALGYTPVQADPKKLDELRRTINEKNRLFFLKWRPQNETYITGFRKYEQGRHVAEIPMFDPLVAEQEKKISDLRIALSKGGAR